jgi:hypothetical protein
MGKITALFGLFRRGAALADPGALQNSAVLAALVVALAGMAKAFGYDLHIDDQTAQAIAGGVAALAGVVLTITSKSVGLPPKPSAGNDSTVDAKPVADAIKDFPKLPGSD